MPDKNKVIIFDGDDTLWKTQELYDNAKKQFDELMKSHDFNEDIITLLDEIDAQRVEILKFSKSRFLESMLITYAILCGKYQKKWDVKIEEKIRDFVKSIFQFPPVLYEDTMETLKTLSSYFGLILFTNGDKEIQEKKVNSLGKEFISYFTKVYLTEMKTEEEYKKIFNETGLPPQNIWVIGNSVKSDINPAIKLGFKAILTPRGIWKYEEKEKLISKEVPIVHSLTQAKDMILKQEKLK
ncbi:MAG TPA: HAD family hydrolase [Candidatus Omnitrophica bacterium]|nr:HAD family hydrolase [Candidatus Omnitrophota bacterium]